MKTGDKRTFTLDLINVDINKDVDFIFIYGVGYVADCNVCSGKSYDYLEECGYITGKEIILDGERYNCRILKCTEWDDCMDYSDSNHIWHWSNGFSWVRGLDYERAKLYSHVSRGYYEARYFDNCEPTFNNKLYGFRPVLEAINYIA